MIEAIEDRLNGHSYDRPKDQKLSVSIEWVCHLNKDNPKVDALDRLKEIREQIELDQRLLQINIKNLMPKAGFVYSPNI